LLTIHKASINRTPVYLQPALEHLFIHSQPLDGLEACAATDWSSPYSECLGCSQYVPVLPEIPHPNTTHLKDKYSLYCSKIPYEINRSQIPKLSNRIAAAECL